MYNLCSDYYDQYDNYALQEVKDLYIEKEMQNYRSVALRKFGTMIPHLDFATKIALSVVAGYRESLPESENIILSLDLDDMEIYAIEQNFNMFKELYLENCENNFIESYITEVI